MASCSCTETHRSSGKAQEETGRETGKGQADTERRQGELEEEPTELKGGSKEELVDAAQLAAEAQPTGHTFETTTVSTKVDALHTLQLTHPSLGLPLTSVSCDGEAVMLTLSTKVLEVKS